MWCLLLVVIVVVVVGMVVMVVVVVLVNTVGEIGCCESSGNDMLRLSSGGGGDSCVGGDYESNGEKVHYYNYGDYFYIKEHNIKILHRKRFQVKKNKI